MVFKVGDLAILNENVAKGLPSHVGDLVEILRVLKSENYDYEVELANGDINPIKESELNHLSKEQKQQVTYIKRGNTVIYTPSHEEVVIQKVDYLHGQAEIMFEDSGFIVVGFETLREKEIDNVTKHTVQLDKFTTIGLQIGKFTDEKNKQYGSSVDATYEMIKVLMERYKNEDNTYTIPESLLQHILLQVRMMDKQNRIFNNPSGEGDSESPYNDLAGYSLIGIDMVSK